LNSKTQELSAKLRAEPNPSPEMLEQFKQTKAAAQQAK
jgi:hypothetical protein